jgi:hypothetical protein
MLGAMSVLLPVRGTGPMRKGGALAVVAVGVNLLPRSHNRPPEALCGAWLAS